MHLMKSYFYIYAWVFYVRFWIQPDIRKEEQ